MSAPARLKLTRFSMRLGASIRLPPDDDLLDNLDGDRCDMGGSDNIMGVPRDNDDGLIGSLPPLLADVEHTDEEQTDKSLSDERPPDDPPMDFMLVLMALSGRRPVDLTPCEQMVESSSHSSSRTMMLESRWAEVMFIKMCSPEFLRTDDVKSNRHTKLAGRRMKSPLSQMKRPSL